MSGMYFDVSERIARDYPRSDVCEIDEFLTRANPLEFKLQDIEDFTNVSENAEAIIYEYIKHGVVATESRYLCPKHKNTALERPKKLILSRKRICPKCGKLYAVEGLETETIFVRKKAPDRPLPADGTTTSGETDKTETPWWKDKKWIAERIGIPIFLIIAGIIIRGALIAPPDATEKLEMPTATVAFEPSSTPARSATPTVAATTTDLPNIDVTPPS